MTTDMTTRAAAVFGTREGAPAWPYGLARPHPRRSGLSAERLAAALEHAEQAQQAIVEWAERHGLQATQIGCCPKWLLRTVSRRCPPGACNNFGGLDYVWLDHPVGWLVDGRPAVLTSAPYGRHDQDPGIAEWLRKDDRLRTAYGPGWYGHGTTRIVMWRTDRIDQVVAAGTEGGKP
jgi:hypothetical protein